MCEQQVGFNCGLTFDDMGHISIGMDAIHKCPLALIDLVLMKDHITTIIVPRVMPAYKLFKPKRRLPLCTWNQFISAYSKAEALFKNPLNNKASPLTRSLAMTSNLTLPKSGGSDAVRKCKWCQGAYFTCDYPSLVGPCRTHLAGRCRNGGKHCKYKHQPKETAKTNESHLTGTDSQDAPEKNRLQLTLELPSLVLLMGLRSPSKFQMIPRSLKPESARSRNA